MKLAEIKHLIERIQGNTFVSLDCITEPKLSGGQKNPHQGRVAKRTRGLRVQLFNNTTRNAYESMVNRRRVAENKPADFKVAALQWGRHVPGTPYIEHKGELYIQTICHNSGESVFLLDGEETDRSKIQGLPVEQGSGRQGLEDENKVIVRTFKLSSIRAARLFGEEVGTPIAA